jgi:flagellar hook-associated protein 2
MIDELLEAERVPLNRMEDTVEEYRETKNVWQSVGRNLGQLRDSARALFGFENPFTDRIATSSDPAILTATAERSASESITDLQVLQVATPDRFLSADIAEDFAVPPGKYGFGLGEETAEFNFTGGSLQEFAETVNRRAGEFVTARVVRNTADTQVLMLEGTRPGAVNTLRFVEAANDLAADIGMIERSPSSQRLVQLNQTTVVGGEGVEVIDGKVTVAPRSEGRISVSPQIRFSGDMVMEVKYRLLHRPEDYEPPQPPPGPTVPETGETTIGDVNIRNLPSDVPLPEWEPPAPPTIIDDMSILSLVTRGNTVELPPLSDSEQVQTLRVPVSELAPTADGLRIENRNTHRTLHIESLRFYDPASRGDYRPSNPITTAQDAQLKMEGITVTRNSNTIDDLVPGVDLQLHAASDRTVSLSVEPDKEQVKNAIIEFVGYYNQLMREINILSRSDPTVIREIDYFTQEEREDATERLGLLQGDMTLNRLKSRLQTTMMNPYRTDAGRELSLLAQLGISTNASSVASRGIDASRLRGYLEINERVLDDVLDNRFQSVKQIFGRDSDGDLVVDSGVAFQVDSAIRPYVQVGGVIATRTSTIDTMISRAEEDIENYNERLDRYEQELRSDFGRMEGALNSMEESRRALQNLNQQQNQ